MATTVPHDQRNGRVARTPSEQWRRIRWIVSVLACAGAVLLAGYQLFVPLETPGDAIRSELEAAAAEMGAQLVPQASPAVLAAMRRDFSGQDVSITASATSSIIVVTLHGLDREACVKAAATARRIVGPVVVVLPGFAAPEDCGGRNDMTWWIMP